jgi:Protein of unknown function (DUF2934)
MLRQRREMGPDATAVQKPSATMSSDATKTTPEMGAVSESVKTAATVSPTENEIAAIAYQLWLDRGCPIGSEQEDWFRAEEMLKNALVVKPEDQFRRPAIPCLDTRTESEILAEFPWEGHWEVWEREWVSARWVWDVRASRVGVSSQTCLSGKAA